MNVPPQPVLRVVLADDNPVVRLGLTSLLESTGQVVVVGAAGDGREAVELVQREDPDVVLLDIRMPIVDGVAATAALADRWKILVLTHSEEPAIVERAVQAGASGYLVHGTFTADELVRAVQGTANGESHLSPPAAAAMLSAMRGALTPTAGAAGAIGPADVAAPTGPASRRAAEHAAHQLSDREAEIMELISQGLSNSDIAQRLFLSEKTVKNHINRIFGKLQVASRSAAIAVWLGTAVPG